MKKVLLFIGIIVSIVLSGCTATDEIVEEEFRFDFDKIKETKIVISFK